MLGLGNGWGRCLSGWRLSPDEEPEVTRVWINGSSAPLLTWV